MQIEILFVILIIIFLLYLLVKELDNQDYNKKVHKKNEEFEINNKITDVFIKYKYKSQNYYISVGDHNKGMMLSDKLSDATRFKIIPISKNKFVLQHSYTELFMNILFTKFYNDEYDVLMSGSHKENNTSTIKILPYKNNFYIKFSNDYYLSLGHTGVLYASKTKDNVFYFKFKKFK